jgi:hypothetical protein
LLLFCTVDGAGGKGTWGRLIDADTATFLDQNDPNYDSDEVILYGLDLYTPVFFSYNVFDLKLVARNW